MSKNAVRVQRSTDGVFLQKKTLKFQHLSFDCIVYSLRMIKTDFQPKSKNIYY